MKEFFLGLTDAVRTALAFSQNGSFTGHWRAGLRVTADHTIHAHAAGTNVGLPGLGCQEYISFVIFAVARHAVITRWGSLERFIWKNEQKVSREKKSRQATNRATWWVSLSQKALSVTMALCAMFLKKYLSNATACLIPAGSYILKQNNEDQQKNCCRGSILLVACMTPTLLFFLNKILIFVRVSEDLVHNGYKSKQDNPTPCFSSLPCHQGWPCCG